MFQKIYLLGSKYYIHSNNRKRNEKQFQAIAVQNKIKFSLFFYIPEKSD